MGWGQVCLDLHMLPWGSILRQTGKDIVAPCANSRTIHIPCNFSKRDGHSTEASHDYPRLPQACCQRQNMGPSLSFPKQSGLEVLQEKGLVMGWWFLGSCLPNIPQASILVAGGHSPAAFILCSQPLAAQYLSHGRGYCGLLSAPGQW